MIENLLTSVALKSLYLILLLPKFYDIRRVTVGAIWNLRFCFIFEKNPISLHPNPQEGIYLFFINQLSAAGVPL